MRKSLWFTLCLLLCVTAAVSNARADSQTWFFEGTNNSSQVPCNPSAPCGEVTLTTSGNTATFTVSSLLSGYIFDSFGFNTSFAGGAFALTSASGEVSNPSLACCGINQDGWGNFQYVFDTGKHGGSSGGDCVVTGGVPGAGCTFTFTITCASCGNLTVAMFEIASSGGAGSGFFAGHLAAGNGNTGFVGGPQTSIDEPASLSVVGIGLLLLGGLLRRRIFPFLG